MAGDSYVPSFSIEHLSRSVSLSQEYVDKNLMCPLDSEGATLQSAALVGHDGGVWAQSEAFPAITAEECEALMKVFADANSETGSFTVGGVKYLMLVSEDLSCKIRGKCQGGGCAINKTAQTIVIGIWAGGVHACEMPCGVALLRLML